MESASTENRLLASKKRPVNHITREDKYRGGRSRGHHISQPSNNNNNKVAAFVVFCATFLERANYFHEKFRRWWSRSVVFYFPFPSYSRWERRRWMGGWVILWCYGVSLKVEHFWRVVRVAWLGFWWWCVSLATPQAGKSILGTTTKKRKLAGWYTLRAWNWSNFINYGQQTKENLIVSISISQLNFNCWVLLIKTKWVPY